MSSNGEQVDLLRRGAGVWNKWRAEQCGVHGQTAIRDVELDLLRGRDFGFERYNLWLARNRELRVELQFAHFDELELSGANLMVSDLTGASFKAANLSYADFYASDLAGVDLSGADLVLAYFGEASLRKSKLKRANLRRANLRYADLSGADLTDAILTEAVLTGANLSGATCIGADLSAATLIGVNLRGTDISGARVFGISAWDLRLDEATIQHDLIVEPRQQWYGRDLDAQTGKSWNRITVDNLELAQFVYLLLNNDRLRNAIDTITSKVVLILGRFTPERKVVLDSLRNELRDRNYIPLMFDFERPTSRDLTETVSTLAHMARFIIADLTDARSLPQELARIVPFLPSVPVQPILLASRNQWAMYETFPRYPWVLEILRYEEADELLKNIKGKVIEPAESKAREQHTRRADSSGI